MRLLLEAIHQRTPVVHPIPHGAQKINVRSRAQQPVLQILAESVVHGQRDHQRRHTSRNSGDREPRNHADDGLLALSAKVAGRDEEFESHGAVSIQHSAFSRIWIIDILLLWHSR